MAAARQHDKKEGAKFLRYFGPLLDALRELGGSGTPDEVVERIALDLKIPDDVQNELLPSGEPRFRNQVAWGRLYLVREGLIDSSKRGVWSLTERGRTTRLSLEGARAIRTKWVRIFQEKRRGKSATAELEVVAGDASPEPETSADDSERLVEMLKSLELGLKPTTTFEIDESFFEEFKN